MKALTYQMNSTQSSVLDGISLVSKLKEGSAVLFPTDTLPALAALPEHADQLWELKKRSLDKPFVLMGATTEDLFQLVKAPSLEDAWLIAENYWPGALTMVLPASGPVVDALNPGMSTIGMRIPACSLARDFLSRSGPLATTSANLSGSSPAVSAKEASNLFPGLPLLGPVPWPVSSGNASTVIAWEASGDWQLLRKGAVIPEMIQN